MKMLKTALATGAVMAALSMPVAALTTGEVIDAMDAQISALDDTIASLQDVVASIPPGTPGFGAAVALLRQTMTRQRQLVSLKRIVPRYPEQRLEQVVRYFNLDISPA